jgi:long-chain acyl-CoA synthetase
MRPHLASLVEDFHRHGRDRAVATYSGVRRHITTYAELAQLTGRFAAEYASRGLKPGDRVVLWGENSAEWIAAFFGCLLNGIIAVPLDVNGSADFASRVVVDVSPRLIVGDAQRLKLVGPSLAKIELESAANFLPDRPTFFINPAVTLDAPFQIIFTSGTTSEPKGIVHTHRNVLASLEPIEREMQKYLRYERPFHPLRFLHCIPLSHVFGQFMGLWIPALMAAEVHFDAQLEPARLMHRIRRERITVLIAVPRAFELLRNHVLQLFPTLTDVIGTASGLPLWKRLWQFRRVHRAFGWKFWALICGGAALPNELELFWGRMGFALIQGYGLTETAALITLNHPFHIGQGTIGKPLPGREVRLGPEGEILVRGDMVSTATWRAGRIESRPDEWLATGDLATQDAGGELRFVGRKGDSIVTAAGLNIYPTDLEAALLAQPAIRAAAVVGCTGPNGPEPVAVLIADPNESSMQHAVNAANQMLAGFQRIRHALRWPGHDFPFTPTGKLLRRKIAEWACAEISGAANPSASASQDALLDLVARATSEAIPGALDTARLSEDLHLDSLGRVQLQSLLEQEFHVDIDDEAMAELCTLGELRALIANPGITPRESATVLTVQAVEEAASHTSTAPTVSAATQGVTAQATRKPEHRYYRWPWWKPVQWSRVAFQELIMRPLVWLLAAPRVVRTAKGLPTGPVLLIANHVTVYDVPLVLYGLPWPLRRRVAAAMAGELLLDYRRGRGADNWLLDPLMPLAYWLLTVLFNVFPLPRAAGFRSSFAHAGDALDHGFSVLVFPEGHLTTDGKMHAFRSGIGLLAQQAEVAVLPVALAGLGELAMRKTGWFRSGKLEVRVGEAIPYERGRDPEAFARALEEAMRTLLD